MQFRRLGNSGLQVSLVDLRCNPFGLRLEAGKTRAAVHSPSTKFSLGSTPPVPS
jgi:hypothetical protein